MIRDKKNYKGYYTQHQQLLIQKMTHTHFFAPESLAFCSGLSKQQVIKRLKELESIGVVCKMSYMQMINSSKDSQYLHPVYDNVLTHLVYKLSLLKIKLNKHFNIRIYNRQFFYALTQYGLQQHLMLWNRSFE